MDRFTSKFFLMLFISPLLIHGQQRKVVGEKHQERQGIAMPNCGLYERDIKLYRQFFAEINPKLLSINEGVKLSSNDPKKLTQQDFRALALNRDGIVLFEGLISDKNIAAQKNASGNYTDEALCAQDALGKLAPDICTKNTGDGLEPWQRFFNLIEDVQRETDGKRPSKAPQPKYNRNH